VNEDVDAVVLLLKTWGVMYDSANAYIVKLSLAPTSGTIVLAIYHTISRGSLLHMNTTMPL